MNKDSSSGELSAFGHAQSQSFTTGNRSSGISAVSMHFHLDNFEDFSCLFGQWGGQFHQLSRGRFRGTANVAPGNIVRAFEASTNQDVLARGKDNAEFATFIPITRRNEASRWQGLQLAAGQLIAKRPEVAYHARVRRGSVMNALLVPIQSLHDAMRILYADDHSVEIRPWAALHPCPEKMKRVELSMAALLATGARNQTAVAEPEGHILESECLRRLVDILVEPNADAARSPRHDNVPMLVKNAVDFMHAHLGQPLTALALCAETGASDRALRRYFRESFGMGPITYHRVMRMHAARGALRARKGKDGNVADIVRRFGFTRPGTFAGEYRLQFGELPSETLGTRGSPAVRGLRSPAYRQSRRF